MRRKKRRSESNKKKEEEKKGEKGKRERSVFTSLKNANSESGISFFFCFLTGALLLLLLNCAIDNIAFMLLVFTPALFFSISYESIQSKQKKKENLNHFVEHDDKINK